MSGQVLPSEMDAKWTRRLRQGSVTTRRHVRLFPAGAMGDTAALSALREWRFRLPTYGHLMAPLAIARHGDMAKTWPREALAISRSIS
jgi:hypothetical protein